MTTHKIILGKNDLFTSHPELREEWSSANEIDPETIGAWSSKQALWRCTEGEDHEYQSAVHSKAKGGKCVHCTMGKVLAGFNDLLTLEPQLAAEVSAESPTQATEVTLGSTVKLLWSCPDYGHQYWTGVNDKVRGRNCPYCAGKKVLLGFNDFATKRPDLVPQWHPDNDFEPTELTVGSAKKVKWICPKDPSHVYESAVYRRKNRGCPYCAGKKVAPNQSVFDAHPELLAEFSAKNAHRPQDLSTGSSKPVLWECKRGHEWEQSCKNRAKHGYGCPVCSNKKLVVGVNDFATRFPHIAKEWDYQQNENAPTDFMVGKGKKSWWKCPQGHSHYAENGNRIAGSQCPTCSKRVSRAESHIAQFVQDLLLDDLVLTSDRSIIRPFELDIVVPSRKVAVEFNGVYWRSEAQGKEKWYHHEKWKRCQAQGYQLIQVWEDTWEDRPEAVKAMIASKLGANQRKRVFGRNTSVVTVPLTDARQFLEEHHIQGWTRASAYLGLEHPDLGLVAVCAFKISKREVVLERYATSVHVIGGQSKLLAAFDRVYAYDRMVTFADLEVSDGNLYEQTGWVRDKDLLPDYRYIVDSRRVHKFNFRIARFKTDPLLEYKEGMSERELALLNGLSRVWDSGKVRYVRTPTV